MFPLAVPGLWLAGNEGNGNCYNGLFGYLGSLQ